ncbi:MAG: hypothetical protein DI586_03535 [Micavibrio aeruginosavorus]|uniref:Uncharacterized protein n=1 Tax=Micavibrio aeruginosavorus TaxID=349221 RepID=A0A2W5FKA6_9BACT|nr:MAG: hypothetical protein DI586_03535 [Micavibrio aeruginosavorus]
MFIPLDEIVIKYDISLSKLIREIREKEIVCQGVGYDDQEGFSNSYAGNLQGFIPIPFHHWKEFNFGTTTVNLEKTEECPSGHKEMKFLYGVQPQPVGNKANDWYDILSGYVYIEVDEKDFKEKVQLLKVKLGKKKNFLEDYLFEIYKKYVKQPNGDVATPKKFLEYLEEYHGENGNSIYEFEVEEVIRDQKGELVSIHYIYGGGAKSKVMKNKTFLNKFTALRKRHQAVSQKAAFPS